MIEQKILIVDDKPENLFALKQLLRDLPITLITANNGNEALNATLNHEFALAILDVQMPNMDGYELAEFMRSEESTRYTPIIFLSAVYSDQWHIFKGYASGAVDFVIKPIVPEILISKINIFLELDAQKRERIAYQQRLESLISELQAVNFQLNAEIIERQRTEEQLRSTLQERQAMMMEINHRVKNNLSVLTSLLDFQIEYTEEPTAIPILQDIHNRIYSISLIHEKLYRSDNLAHIDIGNYVEQLTHDLYTVYYGTLQHININLIVDIHGIQIPVKYAIPCGMIINELVTNAFKYAFPLAAFPQDSYGEIRIALHTTSPAAYTLSVSDNGIGLPSNFEYPNENTLGMFLINVFSQQIQGKVNWHNEKGTRCEIMFTVK